MSSAAPFEREIEGNRKEVVVVVVSSPPLYKGDKVEQQRLYHHYLLIVWVVTGNKLCVSFFLCVYCPDLLSWKALGDNICIALCALGVCSLKNSILFIFADKFQSKSHHRSIHSH